MLEHHSRLAATCKIAKPPFWFIWTTPFAFGYVASAGSDPRHAIWAVFAGLGICLGDMVCNLHNELVDRDEDAINQPERTALLRDAGEAALKALVVSGYTVAGVGLLLVALVVSLDVAAWFAFAALLSLLYNAGLHLKRRSGLAQMAMTATALSMFLAGWTWHEPASSVPGAGVFLGIFIGVTAALKDLPDADGDAAIGALGLFTVSNQTVRAVALGAIFAGPYGVLAWLVATGAVETRLSALVALLPAACLLAVAAYKAEGRQARLGIYQFSFLYVHAFSLALFVAHVFTATAVAVAAALFGARVVALRFRLDPRLVGSDLTWSRLALATWSSLAKPEGRSAVSDRNEQQRGRR